MGGGEYLCKNLGVEGGGGGTFARGGAYFRELTVRVRVRDVMILKLHTHANCSEKTAGTVLTVYNIIGVRESLLSRVYSNYANDNIC